jgi:hypothetical protein
MLRRENVVRAIELTMRMTADPCSHRAEREATDCTLCLAEMALLVVEDRVDKETLPWK